MTIYGWIYLILAIAVIIAVMKTRIDLISVCAVCFILYTMYCMWGYGISGFYRPSLSPKLYYYVYAQLIIIFLFLLVKGRKDKIEKSVAVVPEKNSKTERIMDLSFYGYTAVIVVFAAINVFRMGLSTFASGKANVWQNSDIFYIVSLYGAFVSFAYGIHNKKKLIWIPSLLVELSIFFAGSRAFTATVIIIFLAEYGNTLWKNRKSHIGIYFLAVFAVIFMVIYRMVDTYIMAGDFSGAVNALKNPLVWLEALEFNEPRVIIANYDYVFTTGIRLPLGDCIYRIIDFIPGATSLLPVPLQYPSYFSDWLMVQTNASAGVGGTIWGESYAMMGGLWLLGSTLVWLLCMNKCNKHLKYPGGHSYFIIALGSYLSWYISRLDYNRVAQACKVILLCYLIWSFFYVIMGGVINLFGFKFHLRKK